MRHCLKAGTVGNLCHWTCVTVVFWTETPEPPFPTPRLSWSIHGNIISLLRKINNTTHWCILLMSTVSFGSSIIIHRKLWDLVELYRTEMVARWRRLLNACVGSSVVFWKEFTYTLQTFSGAVGSGNLYWILKLLSSFLLLCLNSRMVFVYLLMVVTAAAMQQAKEVHARL